MTQLIVASGGNIRDLFALVSNAADSAILGQLPKTRVASTDTEAAVDSLRVEYTRRLGDSPYDQEQIPYDKKAERLLAIYKGDPNAIVPDSILYSLLRSRAVQEFNGRGWYGVHPLVVDVLKSQDRLPADARGGTA